MKKPILFFVLFSIVINIHGQQVSIKEAQKMAVSFLNQRSGTMTKSASLISLTLVQTINRPGDLKSSLEDAFFYIFALQDKGFIITSSNKNLPPVLGYSFEDSYSSTIANETVQEIFASWMQQSEDYLQNSSQVLKNQNQWNQLLSYTKSASTGNSVAPLLGEIKWNQGCWYNEMCPEDSEGPCGHAYAGCVATAMGQIMKYWGYPTHGKGQFSYIPPSHPEYGTLSVDFAAATYDWDLMPNTLTEESSQAEINETAKLLYHCGVAFNMDYGPNGSRASIPLREMVNYFNYSTELYYMQIRPGDPDNNLEVVRFELEQGCPLFFLTLHAFVCDGYEGDYYHINWGWDGLNNGNYLINDLFPAGMDVMAGISPTLRSIPCNTADSLALVDLYNNTGGSEWIKNENWLSGPVSSWQGVKLMMGKITQLDLQCNNLNGNLPASFCSLTNMRYLCLGWNNITGELPLGIANMSKLTDLKIMSNKFTGIIPEALGQVASLNSIELQENKLTGQIPSSLGNLKSCYKLNVSNNLLEGNIPATLANMEKMGNFNISHNNITGTIPAGFSNLSRIYTMDISDNNLTGDLPDLSNCSLCEYEDNGLKLNNNRFTFKNISHSNITDMQHLWYNPQKEIKCSPEQFTATPTSELNIDISQLCDVGHSNNQYQWYKEQVPISTSAILHFSSLQEADAGDYHCIISNPAYPELQLTSSNIHLSINTTGIEDSDSEAIKIFPNPCSTEVNLQLPGEYHKAIVSLYDLQGKKQFSATCNNGQITIPTAQLPKGNYLIHIKMQNQIIVRKLLVE